MLLQGLSFLLLEQIGQLIFLNDSWHCDLMLCHQPSFCLGTLLEKEKSLLMLFSCPAVGDCSK